jgi:hypothetical protein
VLIIRIKRCEAALAGGRLEEAFELVREADLRAHRRGQELVDQIGKAFVARGRSHLASGALNEAAADCDRAAALGGNLGDVVQLRRAISTAMAEQRKARQMQDQVLGNARRHADLGQLTVGENLLAEFAQDAGDRADLLKQDISAKRAAVDSSVQKATLAMKSDDWEAAIDHLARLDRGSRGEPAVREIITKIDDNVTAQATDAINLGRLDLAGSLLSRLAKLPSQSPQAESLRRTLAQCREALQCIGRADPAGADIIVRSLVPLWPKAKWLDGVASQVKALRQLVEDVKTGPLRLVGEIGTATTPDRVARISPSPLPSPGGRGGKAGPSSVDVVLHVDGVGGFRVIDRPVVHIGPVSSSSPVDVGLMAEAMIPAITIARSEDDYFLHSARPVLVNDQPTSSKLLAHGDRIGLGPRCRITFRRPIAASASAVLDLSGTRLPQGDVRHVILMDREVIVGPGANAHVRADDLEAPAVLQRREGRLICKINGSSNELIPGNHVKLGPIGLVVAKEA